MAVSLGFGILFATWIILVGVPVTMLLLGNLLEYAGAGRKEEAPSLEPTTASGA